MNIFNPLNAKLNPICHLLVLLGDLTFMGPCIVSIFRYLSNKMQRYTVYLYLETALHVSGGTTTHHQDRIQLYLQHLVFVTPLLLSTAIVEDLELVWVCCGWRYCYLPLSWKSWNRFECAVGGVRHPQHTQTVEQFPDINKLCNVASCWIYIGTLLGAHYILHISRISVKRIWYYLFVLLETSLMKAMLGSKQVGGTP